MLPNLLPVAPVTVRFAFARDRLAQGEWEPTYELSSGHLWWRCLRFSCSQGELHPCAERLAKHLSWHLGDQCTLTDIRAVLGGYAAYHGLSLRTAWVDWGRLVAAGWLAPTRAPANQGSSLPQGPGSGRVALYALTAPGWLVAQLRARSRRRPLTALVSSSIQEATLSPSVPPPQHDHHRGWVTLSNATVTQRRDASALLAGCQEPWRRQRPESELLTRSDWHRLLPLVATVQHQRPDVALPTVLTDRVASARSLPAVLAWRLWRLLRAPRQPDTNPQNLTPKTDRTSHVRLGPGDEDTTDDQHLSAVRALGGPAAARAALAAASSAPVKTSARPARQPASTATT